MLDCAVTGGLVVDGTGSPPQPADVGIRLGRVVTIGTVDEPARRTIDASGLVVAPGFVDLHTHYDAHLFWDPTASPSCLHGVTTVIGGNCGFSIAPLAAEHADFVMRLLARVEGMPLDTLRAGLSWDWGSFGEWLGRLDGTLAVNAGFLVGHSCLRRFVMGQAASEGPASDEALRAMATELHTALAAGSLGFSSSRSSGHHDADGRPVPSRFATDDELLSLARVVREHPGTTIEYIPDVGAGPLDDAQIELMGDLSLAAGRPLNWNVLVVDAGRRAWTDNWLSASDAAAARGGRVIALTPGDVLQLHISFANGVPMDGVPGWSQTLTLPLEARRRALADPAERARLKACRDALPAGSLSRLLTWERFRIAEAFSPAARRHEGRLVGDIAAELGIDPFDALLDIVVSDNLRTSLLPPASGGDDASWTERATVWRDPRAVIGASDAGAHVDMIASFSYPTALLGESVRERGLLSLEEAVRLLSDVPARLYGLKDRGRLATGWWADMVIFDPDRVAPGLIQVRTDLPAGGERLFRQPEGVAHVLVNGEEIVADNDATAARPGCLLRSGRDTETVALSGSAAK